MSDRPPRRNAVKRPWKVGLSLITVVMLVVAAVWWRDRPLASAESLLETGDPAAALAAVDNILERRPKHQRALLLKARALVALQQWAEATQIFQLVGAGTDEELRAMATALLHQQQWSGALPLLEQLAANGSQDAETWRHLTICRHQSGQIDAALASATTLAALPGHVLEGLFQRGVIQRSLGNTHLAIENWEQIEELQPDATGLPIDPAEFFRVYAEDLMLQARPRQALAYFQRSVELQLDIDVLVQLGEACRQVGRVQEATQAWSAVLKEEADNSDALTGLAALALDKADPEAAIELLEPVASEMKTTEGAAYLLRRAYTLLGDAEMAEHWRRKRAILRKSRKLRTAFESRASAGP